MIKAPGNFPGDLHMGRLVYAHRNTVGSIDNDIRGLQDRITQKTEGGQILMVQLADQFFIGRIALQPGYRGDHRKQQEKLGMLFDQGLNKQRTLIRCQTGAEPVQYYCLPVMFDGVRVFVITG